MIHLALERFYDPLKHDQGTFQQLAGNALTYHSITHNWTLQQIEALQWLLTLMLLTLVQMKSEWKGHLSHNVHAYCA